MFHRWMRAIEVPIVLRLHGLLYLKKILMEFFLATSCISDRIVPTRTSPLSKLTQVPEYWELRVCWRPQDIKSKSQAIHLSERDFCVLHMRTQVGSQLLLSNDYGYFRSNSLISVAATFELILLWRLCCPSWHFLTHQVHRDSKVLLKRNKCRFFRSLLKHWETSVLIQWKIS